jgi:mono/diheme cytochrome c family protein
VKQVHLTTVAFCLVAALTRRAPAQELRLGAIVYEENCTPCHGQLYNPGGPLGAETGAIPAFYVGSRYLMSVSPQSIRAAVILGVPGSGMEPMGGALSDEQLAALIDYIESFRQ